MQRGKRITAAVTAAVMLGLSGCSYSAVTKREERTEIVFSWCGDDKINLGTLKGIEAFNENTGLNVVPDYCEPSVYGDKLGSQMAAGRQADVIDISYEDLFKYSLQGDKFYDIEKLRGTIDLSTYPEGSLRCGSAGGKLCGIPYNFDALSFVYNKTVFDSYELDIPKTWDDLFAAAEVMSEDGIYPLALTDEGLWMCCCAYFEQTTGKKVLKNRLIDLKAQDYEVMINFYQKLISQNVTKAGFYFNRGDMEKGTAAGAVCWASDAGYYEEVGEDIHCEIVLGPSPMTQKTLASGWYSKPSGFYAISTDASSPETAAKFVDYLINSPEMTVYTGLSKGVPVSRSALETLEARNMLGGLEFDANKQANSSALNMMSPYLEDDEIIEEFIDICERVRYSKNSAKSAAYTAEKRINSIIETLAPEGA